MKLTVRDFILFDKFLSHPDKIFIDHILGTLSKNDTELEKNVKIYHDIAKLKNNFQFYIRDNSKVKDKNHSLLSGYLFAANSKFEDIQTLFGFLAITSHHDNVRNFYYLKEPNINFGECYENHKEFSFVDEVIKNAKTLDIFKEINFQNSHEKFISLSKSLLRLSFKHKFGYRDFIEFKSLYSNLVFNDKFEAIFSSKFIPSKPIDITPLQNYISNLKPDSKRENIREFHFLIKR